MLDESLAPVSADPEAGRFAAARFQPWLNREKHRLPPPEYQVLLHDRQPIAWPGGYAVVIANNSTFWRHVRAYQIESEKSGYCSGSIRVLRRQAIEHQ